MDLVSQFVKNYKKKIPFYEAAGRVAASQLESVLQSAGIRAMVTSRVKSPDRLMAKVTRRNLRRPVPYKNMKEIYDDIADLCGVRVSLYFPGDRNKTGDLISDHLISRISAISRSSPARPPTTAAFPATGQPTTASC